MYPETLYLEEGRFPGAGRLGLGALVQFMTQHAVGQGGWGVLQLGSSHFSRVINLGRIRQESKPMGSWKTILIPRGLPGKVPGGPLEPFHVPFLKGSGKQEVYALNQGTPGSGFWLP